MISLLKTWYCFLCPHMDRQDSYKGTYKESADECFKHMGTIKKETRKEVTMANVQHVLIVILWTFDISTLSSSNDADAHS